MKINSDLTKVIGKEQEKKWVALSKDRRKLIGSSKSLSSLREKLGGRMDDVIYMKVLSSDTEFAFLM